MDSAVQTLTFITTTRKFWVLNVKKCFVKGVANEIHIRT